MLDVHLAAGVEQVIDLERIGNHVWKVEKPCSRAELLHYQDGMLSFLYRAPISNPQYDTEEIWLLAVNVREDVPTSKRVRLAILVQNSKFLVRNDSHHLYVGSHDGMGSHGHHEWVFQGYDLSNGQPIQSLQLPDFFGTDIRQTVVFEIYDGYLYAVSNQSSFEVEEIDWTSFYHCHRFPLHAPTPSFLQRTQIFRRQHRDGPINDSWTDLGLIKDERTGTLFITECRREWKHGMSTQQRTYYREPLPIEFCCESLPIELPDDAQERKTIKYPANDPLVKVLDEKSKASYSESVPRISRNFHPEPVTTTQTFLLAKTKYRNFIPASSAFLDLVIDDYPPRQPTQAFLPSRRWQQQLRLRIGSRIQASPIDPVTGRLYKLTLEETLLEDSEERFIDRGIVLWPPVTAPTDLLDLLNPACVPDSTSRMIGDVAAMADERSLVYMPAPLFRQDGENRHIVLVNFDPAIRFRDLPSIKFEGTRDENRDVFMRDNRVGSGKERGFEALAREEDGGMRYGMEEEGRESNQHGWWRVENAMHLNMKGFQFEYGGND